MQGDRIGTQVSITQIIWYARPSVSRLLSQLEFNHTSRKAIPPKETNYSLNIYSFDV